LISFLFRPFEVSKTKPFIVLDALHRNV